MIDTPITREWVLEQIAHQITVSVPQVQAYIKDHLPVCEYRERQLLAPLTFVINDLMSLRRRVLENVGIDARSVFYQEIRPIMARWSDIEEKAGAIICRNAMLAQGRLTWGDK